MEQIRNLEEFKDNKFEKEENFSKIIIDALSSGDINEAMRMKDKYNIPDDIINSQEVQELAKKAMLHTLPKGRDYIQDAVSFGDMFNILEEDKFEIVQKAIQNEETEGRKNNAILIKEKFGSEDKNEEEDIKRVA
jgi:hypothetical protein